MSPSSRRRLPEGRLLTALLTGALAACTPAEQPPYHPMDPPKRVVSLDYGLTETLLELGVTPVGIPDVKGWSEWVVEPVLPDDVADVGSTFEPNLELIEQLEPDLILTTPFLAAQRAQLERIAPTVSLAIYAEEGEPLERGKEVAREIAGIVDREAEAERLIARVEATLEESREALRDERRIPLYFVRFLDPRHARVFGEKSLFDDVLEQLEIPNAWRGDTNYWGFATVGIEELATDRDVRLFYFDPLPPDVLPTLGQSDLWQSLTFVRQDAVEPFPMVLHFGGLPAVERFARLLATRLSRPE